MVTDTLMEGSAVALSERPRETECADPRGILIVDDDAFLRDKLRKILELSGLDVMGEATCGAEAIEMTRQLSPDLIIMDYMMEGMDGIAATREIRSFDPEAKIIILTQIGQPHLVGESFRAGAVNFILKPFDTKRVLSAVRKAIGL